MKLGDQRPKSTHFLHEIGGCFLCSGRNKGGGGKLEERTNSGNGNCTGDWARGRGKIFIRPEKD